MMLLPLRRPSSNHNSRTGPEGNVERWVSGAMTRWSSSLRSRACAALSTHRHVAQVSAPNVEPRTRFMSVRLRTGTPLVSRVLVVNLPKMGRVMLSGDSVITSGEEREQRVLPHSLEHDREKSRAVARPARGVGDAEERAHLDRARHTLVCDAEEGSGLISNRKSSSSLGGSYALRALHGRAGRPRAALRRATGVAEWRRIDAKCYM